MMEKYEMPVVEIVDEVSEGVYLASGDCYTVNAVITQTPQLGRGDYRIQVVGAHNASDGHHSGAQVLTLSFNQPVTYVSSGGSLAGGDGTSAISISYGYHNNAQDNVGLGDVVVQADSGLAITGAQLSCNYDCGQH